MKKLLPSQCYNKNDGFFLANEIRLAFGRKRGFMVQVILNHFESAIINNTLIKDFVFIPEDIFFEYTLSRFCSSRFRAFKEQHTNKQKWAFLEIENFGVEDGLFFKVDLNALFKVVIPNLKNVYKEQLQKTYEAQEK